MRSLTAKDPTMQSGNNSPSHAATADFIDNSNLMQNLKHLSSDKLKSLLKFINNNNNEEEDKENENVYSHNNNDHIGGDEMKAIDNEGNEGYGEKQNKSPDISERKLSFHRLAHGASLMKDTDMSDMSNDSMDKSTLVAQNMEQRNADDIKEMNKPLKNILIHAFEGTGDNGYDDDDDRLASENGRGSSKSENIIGSVRTNDVVDKNEDNHEDIFADAEVDKEKEINTPNKTASKMKLINLDEPKETSNNKELGHNDVSAVHLNDVKENQHEGGGETTSDLLRLQPLRRRKNRNSHYRKRNKEKLPSKIIEEINDAMIKNTRESGDRSGSIQDGSPSTSFQDGSLLLSSEDDKQNSLIQDCTKPTESKEPELSNGTTLLSHNEKEIDPLKRGCRPQFSFSYNPESPIGPEMWKVLHTDWTCQGRKQSPIDIRTDHVTNTTVVKNIVMQVEPAGHPISGVLRNNGHAPTLSLSSSVSVRLIGGNLLNDYYLKQLHFHFGCTNSRGSEHEIDGQKYPSELHLVFWDKNTFESFALAAKSDRGIVVVAVLFQRSLVPSVEAEKTPLSQITQILKKIPDEGDSVPITEIFDFRLEKLVPMGMNLGEAARFFTYEGSLSTPGCYESVTWIVFDFHPIITDCQLEMFRKLKSAKVNSDGTMCDNFRPIQKSYGRRIFSNII
eukprot:gene7019-7805_t